MASKPSAAAAVAFASAAARTGRRSSTSAADLPAMRRDRSAGAADQPASLRAVGLWVDGGAPVSTSKVRPLAPSLNVMRSTPGSLPRPARTCARPPPPRRSRPRSEPGRGIGVERHEHALVTGGAVGGAAASSRGSVFAAASGSQRKQRSATVRRHTPSPVRRPDQRGVTVLRAFATPPGSGYSSRRTAPGGGPMTANDWTLSGSSGSPGR